MQGGLAVTTREVVVHSYASPGLGSVNTHWAGVRAGAAIPDALGLNVDGVWRSYTESAVVGIASSGSAFAARRGNRCRSADCESLNRTSRTSMRTDTPGWRFYQKHLSFFYTKDIEGLLASDYAEDARLISYDFAVRGHAADATDLRRVP